MSENLFYTYQKFELNQEFSAPNYSQGLFSSTCDPLLCGWLLDFSYLRIWANTMMSFARTQWETLGDLRGGLTHALSFQGYLFRIPTLAQMVARSEKPRHSSNRAVSPGNPAANRGFRNEPGEALMIHPLGNGNSEATEILVLSNICDTCNSLLWFLLLRLISIHIKKYAF